MILLKRSACLLLVIMFLLSACVVSVDNISAEVPEPEWEAAIPLPYPIYLAASAQDDDYNLYIMGGRATIDGTLPTHNATRYDLETGQIAILASMPIAVSGGAAAIGLDGRVYVFGGLTNVPLTYNPYIQIYEPSNDTWSLGAPMPEPVTIAKAVAMPDGLIYVMGGNNQSEIYGDRIKNLLQIYDPVANSWDMGPNMPMDVYSGAALAVNDRTILYFGGGNPDLGQCYETIIGYNTVDEYWWTSSWTLPVIMAGLDAVPGPDGQIYLIGGGRGSSAYATDSYTSHDGYCFNPFTGESVKVPNMIQDRKYHAVGFDEEGNLMVIGGLSIDEPVGYSTANSEKIMVMDLQVQWFPQERGIMTGEQMMVLADFNFAFAPYEGLASEVIILNSDGHVVTSQTATAYIQDGNPAYFYVDVPQGLPSGEYEVRFINMHPSDYTWNDLSFDGFEGSLTFVHSSSVQEQLSVQNRTIGDLQDANDALSNDLADANEKLDAMATNLLFVMVLAIVAIVVAAAAVVLLLRKKA